jgi:hypothetical protein
MSRMFLDLLIAPVTAPISGITWIAEKVLDQVDDQADELETLQKQLLTLQLSFDMGDIPEATFEEQEEELLLQIQALQDERAQAQAEADTDG